MNAEEIKKNEEIIKQHHEEEEAKKQDVKCCESGYFNINIS